MSSLLNTIFHSLTNVKFLEINVISYALFKEATRKLDPDKFFEIPQFYMRRIESDIDEDFRFI